jgi:hypothetical protein
MASDFLRPPRVLCVLCVKALFWSMMRDPPLPVHVDEMMEAAE